MKKYIYRTFLALGIIALLPSCNDFLTLEPTTQLSSALAFDNLEGVEAGINGVYSTIHADWVERQWIFAECLASTVVEINSINNTNYQDALRHQEFTDLFNTANYLWRLSYNSIHLINQVLEAIPDIPTPDQPSQVKKKALEGEALFLRGLMYFVLNRFWAQPQNGLSVPNLTSPILVSDKPARASIEEIQARIISDLTASEALMAGIHANNNRATESAVKALLARVYFEFKDYVKAEDYANQVIESGRFSLLNENFTESYRNSMTSENIFSFQAINIDLAALNLFLRYTTTRNNNVQLGVAPVLWNEIKKEARDQRLINLYEELPGERRVTKKFDLRTMNLPYIRLPEMFLIRGESRAINNNLAGSLEDLNLLRTRVGLADAIPFTPTQLLDFYLQERTIEMALEGDYLFNRKRLGLDVGGYPFNEAEFKLVFFIPENEVNLNENMIQNDIW